MVRCRLAATPVLVLLLCNMQGFPQATQLYIQIFLHCFAQFPAILINDFLGGNRLVISTQGIKRGEQLCPFLSRHWRMLCGECVLKVDGALREQDFLIGLIHIR